jgi:hypothetical protein
MAKLVEQTAWECPNCKQVLVQPVWVTAITCKCKPNIPRTYPMKRIAHEHQE